MVRMQNFRNSLSKIVGGVLFGVSALIAGNVGARDVYNINPKITWNPSGDLVSRSCNHYGGHNPTTTDGFDSGVDHPAPLGAEPSGYVKIVAYSTIVDNFLDIDWMSETSMVPKEVKIRFMSDSNDFDGDAETRFSFKNSVGTERIDPKMFYLGEFAINPANATNGLPQVDRKALLANRDANGDVYFNLYGIHAEHNNDFAQFTVSRINNTISGEKSGSGTGTLSLENMAILDYNSETNVTGTAGAGSYIDEVVIGTTDNLGDYHTSATNFIGEGVNEYTHNFQDLKGSNTINFVFGLKAPTYYTWTIDDQRGTTRPGTTNVISGGTYTQTLENTEVYTSPTERDVYIGETTE